MSDELIPQLNSEALDTTINSIAEQIIEEQDIDSTKDLVQLFNWNMSKKNAVRLLKLSGLYDTITDQMIERFRKRSGEFSNADLLKYLETVETSIEKARNGLSNAESEPPVIKVQNNTQVNFNVLDTFDSESKERIADAIKGILRSAETSISPMNNGLTIDADTTD